MRADQQRVRSLLAEAITILCKNTLAYTSEFSVEGLLGITLDNNEVFLVNIKENVHDTGAANTPGANASMMPHQLGIQQMAPPPARPARPVPTSRPIPARSPFMPRRPTFGMRGRGRMRGKHPIRPPSRTVVGGSPPAKRPSMGASSTVVPPADTEVVEVKDDMEEDQEHEMKTDQDNDDDTTPTDNQTGDPLSSLDFGDMMSQYENTSASLQSSNSDDTIPHDDKSNDTDQTNANGAIIIKPEPGKDPADDEGVYGSAMDQSGGMFPPTPSGHVYSSGAMHSTPSGQFMDPNTMPGYSGWGATGTPSTGTPKRSGPGRPTAAAGSPSQGSPSQSASDATQLICHVCGHVFANTWNCRRHVKTVHEQSVLFRCKLCGRVFNQQDNLKRHMRKLHGEVESSDEGTKLLTFPNIQSTTKPEDLDSSLFDESQS